MSKVVFVGNVPYNYGEEQLIDVFKSVGQVVGFRLVFDRDTGKPRGYGFCEFADHETAASAVRNLNNTDVGGRPLRIDLADSDPFLEGRTTVRGELVDAADRPAAFLASLPQGTPLAPGATALDAISHTLGTMDPAKLMEVLAQMKAFVITHPEPARALMVAHPQLAYAFFQGLLLSNIVDPAILDRMLQATRPPQAAPQPPPQMQLPPQHQPPPQHQTLPPQQLPPPHQPPPHMFASQMHQPPPLQSTPTPVPPPQPYPPMYAQPLPPQTYYRPPPVPTPVSAPAPAPVPAPAPAPILPPQLDEGQRMALLRVLSLTPEEISGLQPAERDQIMQLRTQFLGKI